MSGLDRSVHVDGSALDEAERRVSEAVPVRHRWTRLSSVPGDTYTVQRSTTIDAPPERVYAELADFHRWTRWSPWEDTDPQLERSYSGAGSGTGAVYEWSGNRKAGKGRMQIVEATEPSLVRIDLVFEKPWKARNETVFTIARGASGSHVTWSMTGRRTPMTRVMEVFKTMDQLVGPDFEKGLARLRATAEGDTGA